MRRRASKEQTVRIGRYVGVCLLLLLVPSVRAAEPRIADLQVRSEAQLTQIELAVPSEVAVEDRSKQRPGRVVVDEVRLFFPGERLARSRLITVADEIVEEVRLFPEADGVVMNVVVRRPAVYALVREGRTLYLRLQPGVLLAAEPTPSAEPTPLPSARRGRRGRGGGGPAGPVRGQVVQPKVSIPELQAGEGLTVDAEELTYDREANQVIARGRVTIARAGSLLTADEVRINRESKEAQAVGNVQLTDPQGTLRAGRFHLDLDDESGVLSEGEAYFPTTRLRVTGAKFEKSYGQTYRIENGTFTTCDCGVGAPTWSIAGDEIDVKLDGYGVVKNAKFRLFDVPVLYFPIAAFPAKVSRQTGLLAPQIGYSQKRGATFLQPLYIVLNKSADLTLSADVETESRLGGIAEYRYALDVDSRGTIDASFFDESLRSNAERDVVNQAIADPEIPDQRWSVTTDATQELPGEVYGFADVLAVSDDLFLREIPTFSFDPQYERRQRTSRFSSSRAGLYRLWDRATVIGQAIYYQDFIQEDDLTLQRLPQVSMFASERFFDRRLKVRFTGEGVNFARDEGFDGPRIDLLPSVEVPFRWQEYLRGGVQVGLRETAYYLTETEIVEPVSEQGGIEDGETEREELDDRSPTRELFQVSSRIGSQVHRIFRIDGESVEKLKHTIEPGIEHLYIPDVEQGDLPVYDFTDSVSPRNLFTYGITSRLLAKLRQPPPTESGPFTPGELNSFTGVAPAPFGDQRTREGYGGAVPGTPGVDEEETPEEPPEELREEDAKRTPEEEEAARAALEKSPISRIIEWGRLSVAHSIDVDESLQPDRKDHFSDVDVRLRVNPYRSIGFFYESSLDARESELSAANVGMFLRDPRPRRPGVFLQSGQPGALGLSYRFIEDGTLEEIDGALMVPLADSLSGFYQARYDALVGEFLENRWGFRLLSQCRCWILDLSVTDRINPNETEVRAQVTLVGLGSIGRAR